VTIGSPNNYSENSFYDLAVSTGSSMEMPKHLNLGSYLFDMKKNNTKNELSTTIIAWHKKVFLELICTGNKRWR
jgi:hypothetical protein